MKHANRTFQGIRTERMLAFMASAFAKLYKAYPMGQIELQMYAAGQDQEMAILGNVEVRPKQADYRVVIAKQLTHNLWQICGHEVLGDFLVEDFNALFS